MHIFVNSYGTSLKIIDGLLSIKVKDDIQKVPIGKIKKLFLTKSIHLSSDVLYLCLENGIDLIVTERNGHPVGRLWNNRFGSISTIRRKQLDFSKSTLVSDWVVTQILKKKNHQEELLYCLLSLDEPDAQLIHRNIEKMKNYEEELTMLTEMPMSEVHQQIRAYEGQIARVYFRTISSHLPFQYQFKKRTKRPARDMVNSMLNYTYGILYSHIESSLIKAGLDPYIGIFHRDEYNRPVLTYDVIEVFRPWADWVVFHLCLNEVLDDRMFLVENGSFWLQGDAKRILIQHFTDFFEEVVSYEGAKYTRYTHIDRKAERLAQKIKNYDN